MKRTRNGQGHTYKVGNSYRTVIRRGDHIITAMAKTQKESRQKALSKLNSLPNLMGSRTDIPHSAKSTGDYLMHWIEYEHKDQLAHGTYKRYLSLLTVHIVPVIGHIDLQRLSAVHINAVLKQMSDKGQSPRSRQQARAVLSVALENAKFQGLIILNPVENVKIPTNAIKEVEPLTIIEVNKLLQTFKGTYLEARLHIALVCGLRQGEALALTWDDVDFEQSVLQVTKQVQTVNGERVLTSLKTQRSKRFVALSEATVQALMTYRERQHDALPNTNLLFPAENGGFKHPTIDFNDWKRALRICGIKRKRLHDARHTAATLMYSQGVGIETISRILGHSNSAITSRMYVHNAMSPLISAAKALDQIIN